MLRRFLLPGLALCLLGCAEGQKPSVQKRDPAEKVNATPAVKKPSLYDRLGGEKAVVKVVDDFCTITAADERIDLKHRKHFKEGDVAVLKKKLVDQVGQATGGPQQYTGKDMKEAHKGLGLTDQDFDALLDDLTKALDQNKAAPADRDELLGMLKTMRKDVVEK